MTKLNYTAEAETDSDRHIIQGSFDGELADDCRPLFAAAREMAIAAAGEYGYIPDSVTVTEISYVR